MASQPATGLGIFSEEHAAAQLTGAAVIFDLEGFTVFCNSVGAETAIGPFLNRVFGMVEECVTDPTGAGTYPPFRIDGRPPIHAKFLGDGALLIWELPSSPPKRRAFVKKLLSRLDLAFRQYDDLCNACTKEFGVANIPARLRFGIGCGELRQLDVPGAPPEFVGFPINLASRLQSYCRTLGFAASARTGIDEDWLEEKGFQRVIATKLRGFEEEILIVDSLDYQQLAESDRKDLFKEPS